MNDLSTSKPSGSLNTWSSMPWGIFLFLLAVFTFSTPLYSFGSYSFEGIKVFQSFTFSGVAVDDAYAVDSSMQRDNYMRILALLGLGAFVLFNFLVFKPDRFHINRTLGWLIAFYLIWATFSIIWSIDPRFTVKRVGILLLLSMGALYVADRFSYKEIIALVIFICTVAILIGFFYSVSHHDFFPFAGWWRFGGNLHPIVQGWHCGLLVLSALFYVKMAKQNRAVYIGIAFIAFLLLILTRSRMALVSCIMGSAVFLGLTSTKRQGILLFLGIIGGGCLIYFFLGSQFSDVSEKVITLGRVQEGALTGTLTGRIPLWKAIMSLVNQRPLTGYGYDSFLNAQNLALIANKLGWATPSSHSGYMTALGGLGYIGAVTFVMILIISVTMSIRLAERNSDYAFIAAVLVWLIFNLYTEDALLTRPFFPVFLWMIMLAKLGFIREESSVRTWIDKVKVRK